MITSNTVFVIGAGASMPYGFPSGLELREHLCEAGNTSSNVAKALFSHAAIPYAESGRFAQAFRESSIASIDAFLARRSEFVDIGKLAIASVLCDRETPDRIHSSGYVDNWYFALWNAMVSDVHSAEQILDNQVKIVSFNYDRSLEYFFYTAIKSAFGLDHATAISFVAKLPIKHVYGQLGGFAVGSVHVPYEPSIDAHKLKIAAQCITIIPEARDDAPIFAEVREWFLRATNVCFLGFGFDPLNISRLGLSRVVSDRSRAGGGPNIIASGYGLTDAEMGIAFDRLYGTKDMYRSFGHEKNLMTLRNSRLLT